MLTTAYLQTNCPHELQPTRHLVKLLPILSLGCGRKNLAMACP